MKSIINIRNSFLFLVGIVFICCSCGKSKQSDISTERVLDEEIRITTIAETTEIPQEEAETLPLKNPDILYESEMAEDIITTFPDISEKEDWYGDYQLVEYVRPHFGFQPNPDKSQRQRILDIQKQTIISLNENSIKRFGPVNKEDEFFAEYKFDHYIQEVPIVLKYTTLDEELLESMMVRWGREYHLDGTAVDFSEWAFGDEEFFSNIDFRISNYQNCNILVFYKEQNPSSVKEIEYWIDAGNGVIYSLTDQMISKLQRLR